MTTRTTIQHIQTRKHEGKLVVLTAYTAPIARLLDAHVDILLVGDSLGMVVYGMESTLPVSLDQMIAHGRAVAAQAHKALVVIDLPFGSYQESPAQAFVSAARMLKETGAHAVKLEGGVEMAATVKFLVERGVPVMGHVGLKPQHVNASGYRLQAKDDASRALLLADARAIAAAGAFSMVLEMVESHAAAEVTASVPVPTIGIGSGAGCDGQVLVIDDLVGLTERAPKFVRQYADIASEISRAAAQFAAEVKAGKFP